MVGHVDQFSARPDTGTSTTLHFERSATTFKPFSRPKVVASRPKWEQWNAGYLSLELRPETATALRCRCAD